MTINAALRYFCQQLSPAYEAQEAKAMAEISLQHLIACSRLQLYTNGMQTLNAAQISEMQRFIAALLQYYPLQYLIGKAPFCGLSIACSPAALIPRPETEELVVWARDSCRKMGLLAPHILDIGTGTGCIALALQYFLPQALVKGIDISADALALAQHNAQHLQLAVQFEQADILQWADLPAGLPLYDLIISNPPYIAHNQSHTMSAQVRRHEPALALFVPNDNPLLFYDAIARFAQKHLNPNGKLWVETAENEAQAVAQLFAAHQFEQVIVRRDINGKERVVEAFFAPSA